MILDRFLIAEEGLRNISKCGKPIGFELKVNLCYYHGIFLSLLEWIEIVVDGEKFTTKDMLFTVHDYTFDFDEMPFIRDERWEFGEQATLTIVKDGGLASGKHKVEAAQQLNISYMPMGILTKDRKVLELQS